MGKKSHHPIEGFPGAVHNSSLFSDYFLAELIKEELFFQRATREAKEVCEEVRALYERVKFRLPEANEAETERLFIRPVLDILGWKDLYTLQPSVPSYEGTRRPDFCFFVSKDDLENAERHHKGRGEYFSKAVAIGDAKQWSRSLDTKLKGPGDRFANHYPPYQIDFYLRATDRLWGILTNGRHWRLYHRDTSYKLDIYYEVDVATILEEAPEAFPYFWAFFSRDAFTTGFLDRALKGSQEYAARLGEELKDNVYEALRLLAEGLLKNPENGLSAVDLEDIRTNTFVLIYRILFLLYAEDRGLLPMENPTYRDSYSLRRIASEIAKHLDNGRTFSSTAYRYWMALSELFRIVNKGDAHLGVPPYNGGLFDPEKHPLLARWKIGDQYLALAIDKLARAKASGRTSRGPVSYRDLDIQHLGAIYEGLLEHRLAVASEDLAVIKDGSKEIFVPLSEAKGRRPLRTYRAGEVYLKTDKGERKATGSYYTPNYIVEYIVQHTLGPLVEEKKEEVAAAKRDLDEKIKHARGYNREVYQREREKLESDLINKILSIKVLDPAMGSGHFLVEAVDFLARALIEALGESPKEVEEDMLRWARREVVERCIFGVDVNPLAVELAKLSLWLYTVAKDRPLSFLDHHLRVGNSLIGAWIKDLGRLPPRGKKDKAAQIGKHVVGFFEGKLKERLPVVLGEVMKLLQKPSDKVEDIREKEALYDRILALLRPFKEVAHVWVSTYFGNEVDETDYENALLKLSEPDTVWEAEVRSQSWFANAQRIAEERHFFHWELEFPEVFFEETGQPKPNPGFDAVIGNPPYDVLAAKEQQRDISAENSFFRSSHLFTPAMGGKINLYRLFVALAVSLLRKNGYHGFIVPMSLLGDTQARNLRNMLLHNTRIHVIEAFPQKDDPKERVFTDAKLSTCVYVLSRQQPQLFRVRVHPGREILSSSPTVVLTVGDLEELDPENLAIPCYPGVREVDFRVAIKLAIRSKGARLGLFAPSQQGEVNLTTHARFISDEPIGPLVLRGAHIDRYRFNAEPKQGTPKYLRVDDFLSSCGDDTRAFAHRWVRIGYQRGAAIDNWRRLIACILPSGEFCSDTINYIANPRVFDLFAILAILNSTLFEWRFRLTSTTNHVNAYEIDSMPIPPIGFVTPPAERARLLKEGKRLYFEALERAELADSARELFSDLLTFVEERLKKIHKPDPELVRKHNEDPLNKNWQIPEGASWEQSDVVHDLLAFLAEEMIRLNQEIQQEMKAFLSWLETELRVRPDEEGNTGIDALTGKAKLKNYLGDYQKGEGELAFEELWEILKKNKNHVGRPLTHEFMAELREAYERSLAKLRPIKERLRLTDALIDQIVYRLYGLTEEEIQIVESEQ
jgi:Alw26I/Eco31I/Esp3I family type II restriction m6 adenine DNA methyltransferase